MGFLRAFDLRRLALIAATLFLAFLSGHVMQSGMIERLAASDDRIDAGTAMRPRPPALPAPPAATLTPTPLVPPQITRSENLIDGSFTRDLRQDFDVDGYGAPCSLDVTVTAAALATLIVTVEAPCRADTDVMLQHDRLSLSERLDAYGRLRVELPAFVDRATVRVVFSDGTVARTDTLVPDLASVRRAALVWTGDRTVALEGVEPDGTLIDSASPGTTERARLRDGGYLVQMGGPGGAADIYTWPVSTATGGGKVRLQVRSVGCGGVGEALRLEPDAFGGTMVRDVRVPLPECGTGPAVYDDLFRDIRVARR